MTEKRELSSNEAVISSGGTLSITADTFDNDASLIKSGADINLNGGTLNNTPHYLTKTLKGSYMTKYQFDRDHYCHGAFGTNCDWHEKYRFDPQFQDKDPDNTNQTSARIFAQGDININMDVNNGGTRIPNQGYGANSGKNNLAPTSGSKGSYSSVSEETAGVMDFIEIPEGDHGLFKRSGEESAVYTKPLFQDIAHVNSTLINQDDSKTGSRTPSPLAKDLSVSEINIQAVSDRSRVTRSVALPDNQAPKLPYLIETNVSYINVDKFLGSEYFLSRIGYDTSSATLIGDAYYETYLVKKMINQQVKNPEILTQYDDVALMQNLYDNALEAKEDLQLSVGVALTKGQVQALQKDIIWLVEKEVSGKKVLVPEVYLSKLTIDNVDLETGSVISGRTVDIEADEIFNGGTITAKNSLVIKAENITNNGALLANNILSVETKTGDINNFGSIKSDNYLSLNSGRDIFNVGGSIKSDGNAAIKAERDIINTAKVTNKILKLGGAVKTSLRKFLEFGLFVIDAVAETTLKIKTTIKEAEFDIGGDLDLYAGRDILFKAIENKNGTDHTVSKLKVGGNLRTNSGRDTLFHASDITVGKDAEMTTGRDLNFTAVTDRTERHTVTEKDGKQTETHNKTEVERGAKLSIGGNFIAKSDNNINMTAIDLDVNGSAYLDAKNDVNIMAGKKKTITTEESTWTSKHNVSYFPIFGKNMGEDVKTVELQNKSSSTATTEGHIASNLNIGNNLTINSGNNINITAGKVKSGGDMDLSALGRVNIASAKSVTTKTGESDVRKSRFSLEPGSTTHTEETLDQTSLSSSGAMRIDGNQGIKLTSVKLDMGEGGYLRSEDGNVKSTALYLENKDTFKGNVNGRDTTRESWTKTGQVNDITAGEYGFAIEAKNDITLEGMKVKTEGNVSLESTEGDIALTGIKNSNYSMEKKTWSRKSGWFGVIKTNYEDVKEKYNESIDRTSITAANYSAKAGKDIIRQGTTLLSNTIYENGKNNVEKTMALKTVNYTQSKSNSSLDLGFARIDDVHSREDEFKDRVVINEVNENIATGKIVKDFTGNVLLEGSMLQSTDGKVTIYGGSVDLKAVKDEKETFTKHSESEFSGISFDTDSNKMQAGISTHYKGTTDTTFDYDETARGVNVIGEGVEIFARDGELNGSGTYINSGDGKLITKGKDGVNFTEAKETHISEVSHSDDTTTVRAYIGNKWAETAKNTIKQVVNGDSLEGLATAGRLSRDIASSAETAGTLGFYGGFEVTDTKDKTTNSSKYTVGIGSNFVSNGGMNFSSENGDMTFKGSTFVNTGGNVKFKVNRNLGKNIKFKAGEITYTNKTTQGNESSRVNVETNILGHASTDASYSNNTSSQETRGTSAKNTMIINTGGTTSYEAKNVDLTGAESYAKIQDVSKVDTLTIESIQDTETREDRSDGWNANVSASTFGGITAGVSKTSSYGKGYKKWTNSTGKLVGSKDVVGDVDTLNLKSGQVYVQTDVFDDEENLVKDPGEDSLGKMSLTAKKVNIENIKDTDTYDAVAYNIDMSSNSKNIDGLIENGTSSGDASRNGHSKERTTKSFIGNGTLKDNINSGETEQTGNGNLANNINQTQEITKDDTYTDDTKKVTDEMRKVTDEIRKVADVTDFVTSGVNVGDVLTNKDGYIGGKVHDIGGLLEAGQAAENVGKAAGNLADSVIKNLTLNGKDGILEDYAGNIRNQELGLQVKRDEDLKNAIKNMADNPEEAKAQIRKLAKKAAHVNGIDEDVVIEFYNAEDGKMGGHKDGKIYINLAYQDGSAETLNSVLGDELSHYVDYKKRRKNSYEDTRRGPISTKYGNNAGEQTRGYVGDSNVSEEDKTAFKNKMKQKRDDFSKINGEVANTEEMENKTVVYLRKLYLPDGINKAGGHLFGKVTERENGLPDYHFSLEGNLLGGKPKINTKRVIQNDNTAFINGGIIDSQEILPPKGKTQAELDESIVRNSKLYDTNAPQNKYPVVGVGIKLDARNSDTYVDNVVEESGGKIKDFGWLNAPRQNSGEVQEGLIKKTIDTKYAAKILADKLINKGQNIETLKAQRDKDKAKAIRRDRGFKD